jgi:hypothetical protein
VFSTIVVEPDTLSPPVTSTLPVDSNVAVCPSRAAFKPAAAVQVPADGE